MPRRSRRVSNARPATVSPVGPSTRNSRELPVHGIWMDCVWAASGSVSRCRHQSKCPGLMSPGFQARIPVFEPFFWQLFDLWARACRPSPLRHSSSQAHKTSTQSHPKQSLAKPGGAQFSGCWRTPGPDSGPESGPESGSRTGPDFAAIKPVRSSNRFP